VLVFATKGRDGFDIDPFSLGKALTDAVTRLDRTKGELVRTYVGLALEREFANESIRLQLAQALVALVGEVKTERGGNVQDEVYRQFLDGGKRAAALLKRE